VAAAAGPILGLTGVELEHQFSTENPGCRTQHPPRAIRAHFVLLFRCRDRLGVNYAGAEEFTQGLVALSHKIITLCGGHANISNVFGGPGGDNAFADPSANNPFGFRNETPDVTSSNTVLGSGGPRVIQLGLKLIF
jgi:hypothetical protein